MQRYTKMPNTASIHFTFFEIMLRLMLNKATNPASSRPMLSLADFMA